jgi:DNA-binding NarL/FixJ family response regulator
VQPVTDVREAPSAERRTCRRVTVLVCDPHRGLPAALTAALEAQTAIAVVGSANGLEDVAAAIRRQRPDVVLVDLAVLGERGIAGLGELAAVRRSTAVLVMGMVEDLARGHGVTRAGAAGRILMKDAPAAELAAAVRSAAGERRLRVVRSDE